MFKSVIAVASSEAIARFLIMAGMAVVARELDSSQYAQVAFGYSIFSSLWFMADLGVNVKAARQIPQATDACDLRFELVSIRVFSASVTSSLGLILLLLGESVAAIFVLALTARLLGLDWYLRANKKFWIAGASQTAGGLIFLAIVLVLTRMEMGAFEVAFAFSFAYLSVSLITRAMAGCFEFSFPTRGLLIYHLPSSLFIAGSGFMASSMLHLPVMLSRALISVDEIASLGVLVLVLSVSMFVISMVPIAAMPYLGRFCNSTDRKFAVAMVGIGSVCAVCTFLAVLGFERFMPYSFSASVAGCVSAYVFMYAMRRVFDTRLFVRGYEKKYFLVLIPANVFLIACFYTLVMSGVLPVEGYSIALFLSEFVLVFLLLFTYRRGVAGSTC